MGVSGYAGRTEIMMAYGDGIGLDIDLGE